jgi:hypothetical protein
MNASDSDYRSATSILSSIAEAIVSGDSESSLFGRTAGSLGSADTEEATEEFSLDWEPDASGCRSNSGSGSTGAETIGSAEAIHFKVLSTDPMVCVDDSSTGASSCLWMLFVLELAP